MCPIIPTVIEKSRKGERAYDIFSRLLEERIIFLAGPIDDALSNLIIAEILLLASKDSEKDIKLYINSPGGSVTAGLAIYDTMQYISCDITTICIGMAASMAAVLLAAGAENKRFALPNSEVLLHQVAGGITGQASEIEIGARQILKMKHKLNQILAKHTKKPLKTVEKDTDRDFYLSAEDAKKYGVIDEVIKKG
ncbi:MAG: ATP-dependent Clp protease proteolytic subunit [Parcubacteria group bacterium]|nr:ATP-dependent Clp protease proteolytic subunit [Parcubacteria group bacterium]